MQFLKALALFLLTINAVYGQGNPMVTKDSLAQKKWVDAKYESMSLDEKLGQLFMVSVASDQSKESTDKILELVKNEHIVE